jgi:YD repeat-containing protein
MFRRTPRFVRRSLRFVFRLRTVLALLLCCPLLLTSFTSFTPFTLAQGERVKDSDIVRPQPRAAAPEGVFPNLEDAKQAESAPPLLLEMPSTMRSPKVPLAPRDGKRVGDPGTMQDERMIGASNRSSHGKRSAHHARMTSPVAPVPPVGDTQYIQTFFQTVLVRQPVTGESSYWNDILRAAYPNGQTSMVKAAREMGKTLFESAEYVARGTSNTQFVTDLYWAYLLRAPDSGGLSYWSGQVPSQGRENVRRAFDESGEFITAVSTISPSGSASGSVYSLMTQRLEGVNQPGGGLHSRDALWSLNLLNLPGRAGMDLGLTLSYSSASVWTRSYPYVYFDEDNGWPSPGFRFGFPTVQEAFFNAQAGKNAFLLITSSGTRVELRQVGTTTTYEAVDSSYLQLTDNSSSLLLRATDGTQLTFSKYNNEWHCTQLKDSNGNYITVNYNALGHITSIVDTLNRTITFAYDGNENLTVLRQTWNGTTHDLVSFGWTNVTVNPGFSGLVGTATSATMPLLNLVWLDDGTYYKFLYTATTGQAARITRYALDSNPASDNHPIAYTIFDYGASDDALRLSGTRVWAESWTGINGLPSEIQTTFGVDSSSCSMTTPDGTLYKDIYGTGWQRNLVTTSEVWSGGVKQKWTTNTWTQDNTGVSYQTNPRVTQTLVQDGTNQRLTTIDYQTFSLPSGASCSLPRDVYEYQGGSGSALYRRSRTDYNLDANYLSTTRRILGLPSAKYLCDATQGVAPCTDSSGTSLKGKTTFLYDESGSLQNQASQTQHDDTNFGSGFVAGRANLSSTRRYNVDNLAQYTATTATYNTGGSVLTTTDAANHTTTIEYTDSFSDSVNRNTFAYPTKVKDPDWNASTAPNNYSTVQYHYDLGMITRTQGPTLAGQTQGLTQTIAYDSAGRLDRVTTVNTGAYQRYWYGPNYIGKFATVNNVADEAYSTQTFDGLGRVTGVASGNPGSAGGYKAQNTIYDAMGRVKKVTNPAEITGYWVPYGDDAAGWLYTEQTYDWKGRPLRTTNQDGTYKEASYAGCGCAGGAVTTLTDEGMTSGSTLWRRQQKIYSDFLGRMLKTEVLNWDGTGSGGVGRAVILTTVNSYNVRDQVLQITQYSGVEGSTPNQATTMEYDGYGRLWKRHLPEQNAGAKTIWSYNADDTISNVTDARNAVTTYTYNARHLTTNVSNALSGQSTINVAYGYDPAGNRTSMAHTIGGVAKDSSSYVYDEQSRMTQETRTINALSGGHPSGYQINYTYTISGLLKTVTDPFGDPTTLNYDVASNTTSVTGTFNSTPYTYVSGVAYRAWGGVKSKTLLGNAVSIRHFDALRL